MSTESRELINYYLILDIRRNATQDDIEMAYARSALKNHPDVAGDSPEVQERFAIINEAYVSFLGVGVLPPTSTWGNMLNGAYRYIGTAPWLWIFPGLFIVLTVLSINFIGDGMRDALDPHALVDLN